jgi:GTP-binding protein
MKNKVVAVVGRPNVGKSTLFNRVLRRRDAIVDDAPGVTRDRKYALAEWAGVHFELIDTGGYVPVSDDIFEQAIRQQVDYALKEADLVVFIVDSVAGVTPLDQEIAQILKESGVQVVLGVNKVDNDAREMDIHEFYQLGLGDPYPLSAISGRSMGDFLDVIIENLPEHTTPEAEEDVPIRLAVLGRPNVGKSSYVNALIRQEKLIVTDIPGTTRDSIDTRFRYQQRDVMLVDTAGLRKRTRVKENVEYFSNVRTMNALRRCDVAILLLDATSGITDQDKRILTHLMEERKGIVLGINKWDLIEKDGRTAQQFEATLRESIHELSFIPILFISALTKKRVFKLLDIAISVYKERQRHVPTAELNRILQEAVAKNHPPSFGNRYVKINYVTQTRDNPPCFTFFTNHPRGVRQNYRNYLENQFRSQLGFMGVPISFRFKQKN